MAFIVLYDACVLHDSLVRDLLIRVTTKRSLDVRARWSQQILDEMVRSILERRPDIDPNRLARTRQLMCDAIPDALVTGYEALVDGIDLPDPDDRHVLAAAIKGGADAIVTYNLRHFPSAALQPFNIEAQQFPHRGIGSPHMVSTACADHETVRTGSVRKSRSNRLEERSS